MELNSTHLFQLKYAYYYSLYLIARKWFLLLWGHLIYFRGPWKVGRKRLKFSHQGKSLYMYAFQVLPVIVWFQTPTVKLLSSVCLIVQESYIDVKKST